MRRDKTLRDYTNRYFENRNTLAGVKDEDVIAYYKKGIINIKLFEKIHEADAHTIGDLMVYVDKLVDTQNAVDARLQWRRPQRWRHQVAQVIWRSLCGGSTKTFHLT
jgi:ArsR family metal-binding transcriptional regulator